LRRGTLTLTLSRRERENPSPPGRRWLAKGEPDEGLFIIKKDPGTGEIN